MNNSKKHLRILDDNDPEIDPTVYLESLKSFESEMLTSGMKPRTVRAYLRTVINAGKDAGRPIVTAADWDKRNTARIAAGIKQATRRIDQIAIEKYFRHLQDPHYGWAARFSEAYGAEPINPIHRGNRIAHIEEDEVQEDTHALTRDEFRAIIAQTDLEARTARTARHRRNALRDGTLFRTAGAYGLRAMESSALRVSSFSPYHGLPFGDYSAVRVIGKSKTFGTPRQRSVYTVGHYGWIAEALHHHITQIMPLFKRAGDGDDDDLLFRKEDGSAIEPHYLSYRFSQYRKAAGLSEKCTAHGLRRMYATQLALAGVSIFFIQRQLGHSSVETTMRYIKLPPDFVARLVRESQGRMMDV